jgi:Domain of unknown function (DUF1877)
MSVIGNFLAVDHETAKLLQNVNFDVEKFLCEDKNKENRISVYKDWNVIHYGLTGQEEGGDGVLAKVIMGGKEIGMEDELGFRPARLLNSKEVKEIVEELQKIDKDGFIAMFRSRDFESADLYAFGNDALDDEIEGASDNFLYLREYYLKAAVNDHSMVIYLN